MKSFGIVHLSVVPLRASNSDTAEIISELLFGECLEVLETQGSWARVRCMYDQYEGWMDVKQFIHHISEDQALELNKSAVSIKPITSINSNAGIQYLSIGSSLPKQHEQWMLDEKNKFEFTEEHHVPGIQNINLESLAKQWLNTPYLWGGRSIFGIDCSGFTQVFFKILGIVLYRDAYQQATQGTSVDFNEEARLGDLAFFDNEAGKIIHVGILLDNERIIHASGKVRIDRFDQEGIFNEELQKYTHKLRIIKRLI